MPTGHDMQYEASLSLMSTSHSLTNNDKTISFGVQKIPLPKFRLSAWTPLRYY